MNKTCLPIEGGFFCKRIAYWRNPKVIYRQEPDRAVSYGTRDRSTFLERLRRALVADPDITHPLLAQRFGCSKSKIADAIKALK